MKKFLILNLVVVALLACGCESDFKRVEIDTENLSGYVDSGSPTGIYGNATIKITTDSVIMVNMPISRFTNAINQVRDTTLLDKTGMAEVYNIEMQNKGQLPEAAFVDSVIVKLTDIGLIE